MIKKIGMILGWAGHTNIFYFKYFLFSLHTTSTQHYDWNSSIILQTDLFISLLLSLSYLGIILNILKIESQRCIIHAGGEDHFN